MTEEKPATTRMTVAELYRRILEEPYQAPNGDKKGYSNFEAIARIHVGLLLLPLEAGKAPPDGWCELLNELYHRAGLDDA